MGLTMTGKSYLAREIARRFRRQRRVVVFDPVGDPAWRSVSDYATADPDEFLRIADTNLSLDLFIDEAGDVLGPGCRERKAFTKLLTRGRHDGHRCNVLAQRATMVVPHARRQCAGLLAFRQATPDAKALSQEYGAPELLELLPFHEQGWCSIAMQATGLIQDRYRLAA